jgi:tripartite-type tricarboxylate transporter receptor subunit TctC
MIVPYAPGGAGDGAMRALAEVVPQHLGQPLQVENRGGASASFAPLLLKDARPDGYLLGMLVPSAIRLALMQARPAYDPVADNTRIVHVAGFQIGLAARADAPYRTIGAFLDFARANPGRISYGTSGVPSPGNGIMTHLADRLGIEWLHVPFRGGGETVQAVLAGQIDVTVDAGAWAPLVRSGELRLLVLLRPERSPVFPETPTLHEIGLDPAISSGYGVIGPPGMEPALVRTLHDGFRAALSDPRHLAALRRFDMPLQYLDSAAYDAEHRAAVAREAALIRRIGLYLP